MNRENGIKPLTMAMVGAAVVAMGTSGKAQALSLISTYSGQIGKKEFLIKKYKVCLVS